MFLLQTYILCGVNQIRELFKNTFIWFPFFIFYDLTVERVLLYPKYEHRVITLLQYVKKYNCYFVLDKDFIVKVSSCYIYVHNHLQNISVSALCLFMPKSVEQMSYFAYIISKYSWIKWYNLYVVRHSLISIKTIQIVAIDHIYNFLIFLIPQSGLYKNFKMYLNNLISSFKVLIFVLLQENSIRSIVKE